MQDRAASAQAHENHEVIFMASRFHFPSTSPTMQRETNERRIEMVWETPQAIDLRFGMEITMYIATR